MKNTYWKYLQMYVEAKAAAKATEMCMNIRIPSTDDCTELGNSFPNVTMMKVASVTHDNAKLITNVDKRMMLTGSLNPLGMRINAI